MATHFEDPHTTCDELQRKGFTLARNPGARSVLVRHGRITVALWRPSLGGATGVLTVLNPDYISQILN